VGYQRARDPFTPALPRPNALAEMLRLYCDRMHSNEPVHTWDGPD
jgi:hypothetical protein